MSLQVGLPAKEEGGRSRLAFSFMQETSFTYHSSSSSDENNKEQSEEEPEEQEGLVDSEDEEWQGLGLDEKEVKRLSEMQTKNVQRLRRRLAARLARAAMPPPVAPEEMVKINVTHNGKEHPEILLHPKVESAKVPFGKLTVANRPGHASNNSLLLELQLPNNQFYNVRVEGVKLVSDLPDDKEQEESEQLTNEQLLEELENWDGEEDVGHDVVPQLYSEAYDVLKDRHMRMNAPEEKEFDFEPDDNEEMAAKFLWVNCDRCKQWRRLDGNYKYELLPSTWYCEMHPSFLYSSCHSPPEIVRSEIQDEWCTVCLKGSLNLEKGGLLYCAGPCLRAFHSQCVSTCTMSASGLGDWFCSECLSHSHSCALCKNKSRSSDPVTKCVALNCGLYYHNECIIGTDVTNRDGITKPICQRHFCAGCGNTVGPDLSLGADNTPPIRCVVCPAAYHTDCLPRKAEMLTDDTMICKSHKDRHNANKKFKKLVMTQVHNVVELPEDSESDGDGNGVNGSEEKEGGVKEGGGEAVGDEAEEKKSSRRRSGRPKTIKKSQMEIHHKHTEAADAKNLSLRQEAVNKVSYVDSGSVVLPVILDHGRAVLSLGKIDGRSTFCTRRFIYPVGFKSICNDLSLVDINQRCRYVNEIIDGGDHPVFKVTCTDAPDSPFISTSPTAVWALVYQKLYELSPATLAQQLSYSFVNGADKFGLSSPVCRFLIEQLPNRYLCTTYDPIALLENPTTASVSLSNLKEGDSQQDSNTGAADEADDEADISSTSASLNGQKRTRTSSGARKRAKRK